MAAEVTRWEDRAFDPRDDLSLIAEYPAEVERLREVARVIASDPVYRVCERAGEALRAAFLAECVAAGPRLDITAAEDFYAEYVCECPLDREFADGSPVYRRHREADRCRWCLVLDALRDSVHARLTAQARAGAERAVTAPGPLTRASLGRRLAEILRDEP